MTKDNHRRIHLIYGVITGAISVLAGVCLIAACLAIYRSGDSPFSPASVAEHFSSIAIPVYLCLIFIVGGFLLDLIWPIQRKKARRTTHHAMLLHRLWEQKDVAENETVRLAVENEHRARKLRVSVGAALLVLCSFVFLFYAVDPSHYHQTEITQSMVSAMWVLLPCLAIPFAWALYASCHAKKSMEREIELLKSLPNRTEPKPAVDPRSERNRIQFLRGAVLAIALVILVYGFLAGGTADVLTKAINICTECIGLG